ncbi:hypothetical protein V5799_021558 [Amblyomma americanum]|uniref:Uncharacterized protein n=1 Tax=Amblyomma americanum TaxID=6943 RepID=A0AAQ4FPH7_AMBAM
MASSTSVDLEAAVVRSTVGVAQAEPGTEPAINRTLFFAVCTGSLVVIASLVVVLFWYGVLTDPGEMLLRAVRVGGGGVVAMAAAPNAKTTATPMVINYVGVLQTHLPPGNDSNDSVAALTENNSPLGSIIGGYVRREVMDNGTDDSQLPVPVQLPAE